MLKWIVATSVVLAATLAFGWFVWSELSSTVPVPQAEYQECVQAETHAKAKTINCQTTESLAERTRGDPTSYFTVWLTGFTGLLAIVGLIQGLLIYDQISLGRREFESEHRPWMAIRDVTIDGDTTFSNNRSNLQVKIWLENTGRSPAIDFAIGAQIIPRSKKWDAEKIRKELLEGVEQIKVSAVRELTPSEVVFPGEKVPFRRNFMFSVDSWIQKPSDQGELLLFDPVMVGACFYRSTFDKKIRHTSFVYTISHGTTVWVPVSEGTSQTISKDDLELIRWVSGWTAS